MVSRVKELRGKLTSDYKRGGNFGYADVDIQGITKKEFYSHSKIDELSPALKERLPEMSVKPENPVFDALMVDNKNVVNGLEAYSRAADSEYKILNDIASKLGNRIDATGTIRLYTDREPCASCTNVVNEFMERYPQIRIEVLHNNGEILR